MKHLFNRSIFLTAAVSLLLGCADLDEKPVGLLAPEALNRWTPTNTNTDVPKAAVGRTRRVSTRWVKDGSFVRMKNLAIGYNFPKPVLEKLKISKLRIYASAQNILTFTKYKGYDPEVNYSSDGNTDSNRNLGLDYGSYPNAKSYTIGLNLGF